MVNTKKCMAVLLSLVLMFALLPYTAPQAQAQPVITLDIDKNTVEAGGTITATYSIAGISDYVQLSALLFIDGNWVEEKVLNTPSGTVSFSPKYGTLGEIMILLLTDKGEFQESASFDITGSPEPISANIVLSKTSVNPGDAVTISWDIKGGISPRVTAIDVGTYIVAGRFADSETTWYRMPYTLVESNVGSASVTIPGGKNFAYIDLLIEDPSTGYAQWHSSSAFSVSHFNLTGWVEGWDLESNDSGWAYFSAGVPQTGWKQDQGKWYYLKPSNYITYKGWLQQGGAWYYFDWVNAEMQTGWVEAWSDSGESLDWYYFGSDGAMKTGWLQQGSSWYYLTSSGPMAQGWVNVSGVWYYMNANGVMQTGWVKSGSSWYYMKPNGSMATGWVKAGNSWYYMNASGVMQTGWIKAGGAWYYMNGDGSMRTGWLQQGSSWYYLRGDGSMATGDCTIDGAVNVFNGSGVWVGYK